MSTLWSKNRLVFNLVVLCQHERLRKDERQCSIAFEWQSDVPKRILAILNDTQILIGRRHLDISGSKMDAIGPQLALDHKVAVLKPAVRRNHQRQDIGQDRMSSLAH